MLTAFFTFVGLAPAGHGGSIAGAFGSEGILMSAGFSAAVVGTMHLAGLYRPDAVIGYRQDYAHRTLLLLGLLSCGLLLLLDSDLPSRNIEWAWLTVTVWLLCIFLMRTFFSLLLGDRFIQQRHPRDGAFAPGGSGPVAVESDERARSPNTWSNRAFEPAPLREGKIVAAEDLATTPRAVTFLRLRRAIGFSPYAEPAGYPEAGDAFCRERETGRVDLASLHGGCFDCQRVTNQVLDASIKRALDLVLCASVVIAALPVMLLVAVAIKFESPGPVFYRQERVGFRGRIFTLIKFRSMRVDAETNGEPVWAAKADARVTRVGRLIRLLRIDELPQLLNVWRGEMSFVGPRPERPYFVDRLAKAIPYYCERETVKPGITGWAQVNYPYGASVEDARHKLSYDLYYVKHRGLALDLLVLLLTIRVVMWPNGAR